MKQKKAIIGIFVLLFITLLLASSVSAARFSLSRDNVNRVTDSMGEWLKGSVLLWYSTDASGDLRTEYESQRRVVDFILFFIMFFSLALLGLRKVYKEGGGGALNALAFSIGALLSLALVAFTEVTLGVLFPFARNIIFFIILWIVYLVVSKLVGDDKTSKKLISFVIAVAITYFAFTFIGAAEGWNPFKMFDMTTKTEDQSDDISKLENALRADPVNEKLRKQLIRKYYLQGQNYVEQQKYDEAAGMFGEVIKMDPNPQTNRYFDKAVFYLREGIFDHMAKHVLDVMEAKLYAGQIMAKNQWYTDAKVQLNEVVRLGKRMNESIEDQEKRIIDIRALELTLRLAR